MLIAELQELSADPKSWAVVALMALVAGFSIVRLVLCPYVHGTRAVPDEDVARARATEFTPGARFALMMLIGAALTLSGLFMIASGLRPTLALAALVAGVVIIQTEPPRLRIREMTQRVIALRDAEASVLSNARERLRGSHMELAASNLVLLLCLVTGLLAF